MLEPVVLMLYSGRHFVYINNQHVGYVEHFDPSVGVACPESVKCVDAKILRNVTESL